MDKWKRIIEPAGDSESSDWSSEDSTASCEISHFRLRPFYNSKLRTHPQEGRSSSQNQVDDQVEDCWQEFPAEFRSQPKKRCLSNVAQVNVNCSTSVVTRDSSNEEPSTIETDKDRSDLYSSSNRSWEIESEDTLIPPYRKLSRYKQKYFTGASTSYQVPESASHSSIANISPTNSSPLEVRSKCFASQEKRERLKRSENDDQLSHETEQNEDPVENRNDPSGSQHTIVVNSNNSANDGTLTDPTDNTKDQSSEVQSSSIPIENNQQRDIVELPNMDLNQSLISLLECPVCLEYVFPPINQCKRGHLVCANCKPQLNNCPTCRSRFTETRNLAMEQVAEKLYYPCRNHTSGCKGMYLLQDKREHEANCHYRTYKCIVSHCMWKGFRPDILGHMIDVHKKIVVYGENQVLRIKLDTCVHFTQNWIVSAFGQVFRVNFLVSYLRSQIAGCVQYLGPRKYACNFSYTFDVRTDNRRLLYSRQTHGDTGRLMNLYNTGDCFYLRTDAANYYVSDKVIKVVLHIKKTSDASE